MKKIYKITLILLIILSLYSTIFSVKAIDIWGKGNNFLNVGSNEIGKDKFNTAAVGTTFEEIVNFLWGLGLLVVFVSTIVLGIRYMMVSPNEKSRIKQATMPYIIGVVIIFGALTIWRLIIQILEGSMLGR